MEKVNTDKFSQRLQDMNNYLDFIPIGKSTERDKTQKAYGKALSNYEIRSIMVQAIPPEWTVNRVALGKELEEAQESKPIKIEMVMWYP
jgi:hypothetical protein